MSDIRAYFKKNIKKPVKRSVIFIDDDDDKDFKPERRGKPAAKKSRARIVDDSDEEEKEKVKVTPKKKATGSKATPPKAKRAARRETTADEFFGSGSITRSKASNKSHGNNKPHPSPQKSCNKPHPSPQKSCRSLEVSLSPQKSEKLSQDEEIELPPAKKLKISLEAQDHSQPDKTHQSVTPPLSLTPPSPPLQTPPISSISPAAPPKPTTPESVPKPSRSDSYRAYLNRQGPRAPGSKVIPQGTDNCLFGLTFVFTGVGESLEREEASDLAKRYGGRVTTNISKKTDYVVVGAEAGESKLKKAHENKTKQIDEDEFLDLIRTRSEKGVVTTPTSVSKQSRKRKRASSTSSKPTTPTTPATPTFSSVSTPTSAVVPTTPTSTRLKEPTDVGVVTTPPIKLMKESKGHSSLLWVDKYSPVSCKQIIGQQGKRSNVNKLIEWLKNWFHHYTNGGGSSAAGKKTAGEERFKAALLSGPPGVGKTTSAILACKEVGYAFTELNASAARSKKSLQQLVTDSLSCHSMDAYIFGGGGGTQSTHHVFIMDEVDGMAGNEDRGGVQELIQLIKTSHVPIICICNDRHHPKIRSLSNYCYDLRFTRPKLEQIKGPMMSVAFKEGIKINPHVMNDIIVAANHDIRQVLHNLSLFAAAESSSSDSFKQSIQNTAKTSIQKSPFDVVKRVFLPFESGRELSLREKSDLFFSDYSFGPLFVQENYLHVKPMASDQSRVQLLQSVSTASDAIAQGDIISRLVRTENSWQLLPTQAIFSSVIPGETMRGDVGRPDFPQWLGNNSKLSKNDRLLQQLTQHTRLSCSCNKMEFLMNYGPFLSCKLTQPLIQQETEGIDEVIDTLRHYDLTREDWESLVELNQYSTRRDTLSLINSKVKAAFTRAYNKADITLPYTVESIPKKKRRSSAEEEEGDYESSNSDTDSEDASKFAVKSTTKTASGSKRKKTRK